MDAEKGVPYILGSKLNYLLRFVQVAAHKDPPPMWKELVGYPKRQHLTTHQRALDDTARRLGVWAPIVATPVLPKLTLSLGFRLEHRNDLVTSRHKFGIGQHTSAAQKVLKARSEQHQVIADSCAAPSLADMATLMAPDSVSLSATLSMVCGGHSQLRVVLATLFGPDHPTTMTMKEVKSDIMER